MKQWNLHIFQPHELFSWKIFIYSFNKYWLIAYQVFGRPQSARHMENKKRKSPCPYWTYTLVEIKKQKQQQKTK